MICFQTSARVYKIGLAKRLVEASWNCPVEIHPKFKTVSNRFVERFNSLRCVHRRVCESNQASFRVSKSAIDAVRV